MDKELFDQIKSLIDSVGLPGALLLGMLFLGFKVVPPLVNLFTRTTEAIERIAETLGHYLEKFKVLDNVEKNVEDIKTIVTRIDQKS